MKAIKVSGKVIELCDVPEPTGEGVLVNVKAVGICGSDIHLIDSNMMKVIPGHEISGITPDGQPVAIEPMLSCGECVHCNRGSQPYCESALPNTLGIGIDGGMAEKVLVPQRFLTPLPKSVKVQDAFLIEPLAVAVRSLLRANVNSAKRIIVVGGGTIGLCCVAVAKYFGVDVELLARHNHQIEAGFRLGTQTLRSEPAALVIEAAGTESALATAINLVAKGGTVAIPSTYWDPIELPGMAMGMKEVTLIPSITYGTTKGQRDFVLASKILATTPELPKAVITHRFPLDAALDAFSAARSREMGAIKVALEV
ncbi:MAG: alcohol dehydrogenase [Acidimicrobiaceae bacterium]|jgi:threonine dehydrogenase-like Zn-dependent dehydrogenase|nr:alcohol dehydrogenase [Acidimicrobiaceae bacterium]|tara:strand:- start:6970 stop:7905 length:936 start_codon:yes stop_codon:yes gene_type:complete